MDITDIKRLDCREIVARELGAPIKQSSKNWAWACPFHGGTKPNFTANATRWRCWSDCSSGGDVIAFIQQYKGLSFREACKYLGATDTTIKPRPQRPQQRFRRGTPPKQDWQAIVEELNQQAIACLWSDKGKLAREYLAGRGLTDDTIQHFNLGYIPETRAWYERHGIKVPSGVTIPSTVNGQLWQVRVRRVVNAKPDDKYRSIGDGRLVGSLFNGDAIQPHKPIVIVESEMDCMTLHQLTGDFCPVALSSASNTLTKYWLQKMAFSPYILMRTDADPAGKECLARHQDLAHIIPIHTPSGIKDINEFFCSDAVHCQQWLAQILNPLKDKLPVPTAKQNSLLMPLSLAEIAQKAGQALDDTFVFIISALVENEQPYIRYYTDSPERNFSIPFEQIKAAYEGYTQSQKVSA